METLIRFSHVYRPGDLSNTLLSRCFVLEMALVVETERDFQEQGRREGPPIVQVQLADEPAVTSSR